MKSTALLIPFVCASLIWGCATGGSGKDAAYGGLSEEQAAANARAAIAQADRTPGHVQSASPLSAPACPEAPKTGALPTATAQESPVSSTSATESTDSTAVVASKDGSPARDASRSSDKSHRGKVKELFALMDMQALIDATIQETIAAQIKANPALAPFKDIMLEFFAKHMSWKSQERGFIDDYMETFSEGEIEDMIAFYKTPTGAKAISTMPGLMRRGSQRGLEQVQKHMPELQKTLAERLGKP